MLASFLVAAAAAGVVGGAAQAAPWCGDDRDRGPPTGRRSEDDPRRPRIPRRRVTLDQARTVTALFPPERFRLVVSVLGEGTVSGAGGACRVVRCQRSLTSHSPARLRATPAAGWRLAGGAFRQALSQASSVV